MAPVIVADDRRAADTRHERESALRVVSSARNRALLDTFAKMGVARQAKADDTLCSIPEHERGPGFFRSLALMAAWGA
jgi:hypothetical protein